MKPNKLLIGLLIIGMTITVTACKKSDTREIASIYVGHFGYGVADHEYKVDLANGSFWEFLGDLGESNDDYSKWRRDPQSENEGFDYVKDLDQEAIERFVNEIRKTNFTNWKESYRNNSIMDGHQWQIEIIFTNGTIKEISGSNAYPRDWTKVNDIFYDLLGKNIIK